MNKSKTRRQAAPLLIITAVILALSFGPTVAGNAAQAQEPFRYVAGESAYGSLQSVWSASFEGTQVPQDIRIMQRIVRTALGEVEAPELPEGLADDAQASGSGGNFVYSVDGSARATLWLAGAGNRTYAIGSRDVTGFYMQGMLT